MSELGNNVDSNEVGHFDALASQWWDPHGPMRSLHEINGLRVGYIDEHCNLADRAVLDVGCGGGLLSEAMAGLGAKVTAI
ncbi:MAG: 50S ribosomal protein L11 methyltransferase, partial [Chromatiales bacterium]